VRNTIPLHDLFAAFWFLLCWAGYSLYADFASKRRNSLLVVMNDYRVSWMRQMLKRENRMVDAALIGNLLRSISFFASTTIFVVLGLFTLLKYREEAGDILGAIPYAVQSPPVVWEMKIFLLVIIFVYAFFKFTWSIRQYNYSCALVGAAPPPSEYRSSFEDFAQNGGRLMTNAARHFNSGLRAYYFGMAALSWFVNAYAFMFASVWVVLVLYRREFLSHALDYLNNPAIFRAED
jgi:uncharacterized membrane protein